MNFHGGDVYRYSGDLIDFSSNINPLGVPDSFRRLLLERMEDFTRYPDIEYQELRKRIADYLHIYRPENIVPGNGAVELIYKLVAASGASRIVGLRPTFSEYGRAAMAAGVEYVDVPAFTGEFDDVDRELILKETVPNSIVIICNPNNPTGTLIKKAAMRELAEALLKRDCKLVIDEAFIEFTDSYPSESMADTVEEFSNLTVIRAATKFFGMPGIRLGYAIVSDKAAAKTIKEHMEPWNINTAAVIAAYSIFDDQRYIEKSRSWIRTERGYLYEGLANFRGLKVYPSKANFHLLELTDRDMTASQLKAEMVKKGVLIRTAEGFNGLSEFHLRLAVKDRSSNDVLINTLKTLIE